MDYSVLNFCGITSWVSKQNILPFEIKELYYQPTCIAIIPIKKEVLFDLLRYAQIKQLYIKMLAVLELSTECLLKAIFPYENQKILPEKQKLFTLNLLNYFPKMVLTFGDLEFLDHNLLRSKNVWFKNILHPEHLLNYAKDKSLAYQDLLVCRQHLRSIKL